MHPGDFFYEGDNMIQIQFIGINGADGSATVEIDVALDPYVCSKSLGGGGN